MFLSTLCICAINPAPSPHSKVREQSLVARRTESKITIDGKPDEIVWSQAPSSNNFTERVPNLGATPKTKTRLQVAYDDDNLYVLLRGELLDAQPKVETLIRDDDGLMADDLFMLQIDPLRDLRTNYTFAVNAAGVQSDSLTLEDGRISIRRWDGVWQAEASRENHAFTIEYKIPFYVLGVRNRSELTMGLNVTRKNPTDSSDYDWRLIVPPRPTDGASSSGTLIGIKNIQPRPVLELIPYALTTTNFSRSFSFDPRKHPNLAAGVDARYQTGPGSYIEASLLTDFSQVDSDQVRVALNRFALFFPEQRPFFINGSDVFSFGHESSAQLFFSRRIGLDGVTSPVLGGIKAYGRTRKLSYGFMNVQTASTHEEATKSQSEVIKAPQNFSVARVRYAPIPQIALGAMGVGRKEIGGRDSDTMSVGVDFDIKSKDNRFRSYSFAAATWPKVKKEGEPASKAPGKSLSSSAEYRGLFVRPSLKWVWSDKRFSAPLGFFERPNSATHQANLLFVPRPQVLGLRDIEIGPRFFWMTTPDYGRIQNYVGRLDIALHWKSNWHGGYFFAGIEDRVPADFSIYGNKEVTKGRYLNLIHGAWFETPSQHRLYLSMTVNVGRRFGGPYRRLWTNINLRLTRHFRLNVLYDHVWGEIGIGEQRKSFNVASMNASLVLAFHKNLSLDGLGRLNLTPTQESVSTQARLRWRYAPGSDLFVVYANQTPMGLAKSQDPTINHRLTLKLNWYWALALRR